ncbi:melanoma-associated antigen B3 [Sorex araneus]|uniref:melanoma-associated antigen B3 n=1 Tax=Sorex araneus TaxID=42254 RepID=UPI002433AABC|nr:melanoma-associated antigen B3 [Sorex araneus]
MPRSKKSKSRKQARGGSKGVKGAQATTTAEEEKSLSSTSHSLEAAGQEPAATSRSTLQARGTTKVPGRVKARVTKRATRKRDEEASSSGALHTTARPRQDSLTKVTALLMEFLMIRFKKKKPILKAEILKIIGKKYKHSFSEILKRASFNTEVVFGIDLKEMESPKDSYALVSKIDLPNNGRVSPGRGFPKTSLLINVLGVIFLKGNCASEETIWAFLNKMKVYAGEKHFIFGEPRKLITEDLVRLKYLEYRQVAHSDPPRYEFLWGSRSHAEISKMQVLEFLAKINKTVPSAFQSCYEEALREEESGTAPTPSASTSTTSMNAPELCPEDPVVDEEIESDASVHIEDPVVDEEIESDASVHIEDPVVDEEIESDASVHIEDPVVDEEIESDASVHIEGED